MTLNEILEAEHELLDLGESEEYIISLKIAYIEKYKGCNEYNAINECNKEYLSHLKEVIKLKKVMKE
jgi:hypothetical protein